ncbi:MAG: hypothetical protein ICV68_07970 [Pyrinomonadaceae bacterium]|nr:hypothetical protein [Pyrinomonadaceae bacterium]
MSDFLHNLIARSYDLKPVARPRLASRFEPTPHSPLFNETTALEREELGPPGEEINMNAPRELFAEHSSKSSSTEETQTQHSTSDAEQLSVRSIKTERTPSRSAPTADDANASPLSADERTIANPSTQNISSASDMQSSTEQSSPARHARQTSSSPSFTNSDDKEHSINQTVEVKREAALPEQGGPHELLSQSLKEHPSQGETQSPSNSSSNREHDTQDVRRGVVPAKVSAQSKINESVEPPAHISAETQRTETTASSAPVIRVTIGRIDVRAVMTDSKAERRPAPAPTRRTHAPLSLEEYLKQRNGGGR